MWSNMFFFFFLYANGSVEYTPFCTLHLGDFSIISGFSWQLYGFPVNGDTTLNQDPRDVPWVVSSVAGTSDTAKNIHFHRSISSWDGNCWVSPDWCSSMDWARAANQRVAGSIPSQGTCLGCRPIPSGGRVRGNHTLMFLSLSLSLPSPL